MANHIELGVGLLWAEQTYEQFVALIKTCESLGYDELWIANEKFFREMYIAATVAAIHTTRPKIGTFIADPYTHHPALTATAIGTLNDVCQGRAILGIGAGGTGFPPMGIKRRKPALAIKEAIEIIRRLLAGDTINYDGEIVQFTNGRLNFQPSADISIVVASRGNLVLQTGGELADAVMVATYAEPEGIRHALSRIEIGAKKAGRNLDDISIISRIDACIHTDRQLAYEAVKPMVGVFLWTSYPDRGFVHRVGLEVPTELEKIIAKRDYNLMSENTHLIPDAFVDKFCWAGTADEVTQQVLKVTQMGIQRITFLPHAPQQGNIDETIYAFAEVVRPQVEDILNS